MATLFSYYTIIVFLRDITKQPDISTPPPRDNTVDILRGMAIFTMVAANMAAHTLLEPHPFGFRLYGSFAAPAFIFLAGMMVSFTSHHKLYPFKYYLVRGLSILAIAALIDLLCWGIVPFATFDVLYLIGLALPIARLFLNLDTVLQVLILLVLFAAAPVLQHVMGYQAFPVEPAAGLFLKDGFQQAPVLRQLLVDGWFPLFPWLGVALTGAFTGRLRIVMGMAKTNRWLIKAGTVLLTMGAAAWWIVQPELITREGYSELFYPPTLYYLFAILGSILLLLALLYPWRDQVLLRFFIVYGKSSLLVYILHTVFIVCVFNVYFHAYGPGVFTTLYLCHALVLWLICYVLQAFRKGRKLPFIIGFLLGG